MTTLQFTDKHKALLQAGQDTLKGHKEVHSFLLLNEAKHNPLLPYHL